MVADEKSMTNRTTKTGVNVKKQKGDVEEAEDGDEDDNNNTGGDIHEKEDTH
jgi:hypothetical protein